MKGTFGSVKVSAPKVSKFDLSHEHKLTAKMGYLYPVAVEEIVPGDRWSWSVEAFMRVAPLVAPIMHRVDVCFDAYFVPTRIIWTDFEKWRTGGITGEESPVHPYWRTRDPGDYVVQWAPGTLLDHMGLPPCNDIPTAAIAENKFSALPLRAYLQIFNDWYIDRNNGSGTLFPVGEEGIPFSKGSGNVALSSADWTELQTLRRVCWEKDAYTSALLDAQRGAPVAIPLAGSIPEEDIVYKDVAGVYTAAGGAPADNTLLGNGAAPGAGNQLFVGKTGVGANGGTGGIRNIDEISLSGIAVLVEELRMATSLQMFLERMSVGGSRYTEYLLNIFGVKSSDARLQRAEFLGGSRGKMVISEVLSSVEVEGGAPQGNMTGHAVSIQGNKLFSRFFEEDGYVMVLMFVRPKTGYMQGVHRMWNRFDQLDMYIPQLAHLGEQVIKGREVYWDPEEADIESGNDEGWGYQPRNWEYKNRLNRVAGEFRTTLAHWHMDRIFTSRPNLDVDFTTCEPTTRIFNVEDQDSDQLYIQLYHRVMALRPMPYYATPRL